MSVRPAVLRKLAYRVYRALPPKVRGRVVRLLTPNYTVGSVVLLRDADQRLLLVRQPGVAGWSLPGGLGNRGETPAQTAARELAEEVNVTLGPEQLTPAAPNAIVNARAQQVDSVFTATVDASTEQLRADAAELAEVAWHGVDALPPLTVPTARLLAHYGLGPYADYATH